MSHIHFEYPLPVAARDAWVVLSDFGSILNWLQGNEGATIKLEGEGVGMVRELDLPNLGIARHRLDINDDATMTSGYSLLTGHPLGMSRYAVKVSLTEAGDSACLMAFDGDYDAQPGFKDVDIEDYLKVAYAGMGDGIVTIVRKNA